MLIKIGKQPDELKNNSLGFWLPVSKLYGNFTLKYSKIIYRLDQANRRVIDSWKYWKEFKQGEILGSPMIRHQWANEELVSMMRRAGDELVSLIWCLESLERNGCSPKKIKLDSLGAVIKKYKDKPATHPVFSGHLDLLETLNEISNAFKHSFIQSDQNLVGNLEPRILALGLDYNDTKNASEFHEVSLSVLTEQYSDFFKDCRDWLKEWSERMMDKYHGHLV